MIYISVEETSQINRILIERYSPREQIGVKEYSLLESAVSRPIQSAFGQDAYPTIYHKGAALFESLAKNHPFFNANKRTAFTCLLQFLYYNGYTFKMNTDRAVEFVVDTVNHKYAWDELVNVIKIHSHKIQT